MKKHCKLTAFIIIGITGALWHFFYQWSGENRIVGLFAPVNESTWEHLKILFFPVIIYSVAEYLFCGKKAKNFIPATAVSAAAGMLVIVALFYTYSGVIGYNISFIDISTYYIGLAVTLAVKSALLKRKALSSVTCVGLSVVYILLMTLLFVLWTYEAPSIGIFTPPAQSL